MVLQGEKQFIVDVELSPEALVKVADSILAMSPDTVHEEPELSGVL